MIGEFLFPRAQAGGPITSSAELFREVYGGQSVSSGAVVNDESAMRASAVFACVSLRAEARAHLPFGVFKKRQGGGRDELPDDDLVRLLNKPNPWQTRMGFLELRSQWLDLRGNFFALKIRSGAAMTGPVEELIPLNPSWVSMKLLPGGEREYRITPPPETGLGVRTVSQEEMLHHVAMPRSAWEGRGILTAARESVGLSMAAEQHGAKVFKNGTRLSGVLQSANAVSIDDEARKRIQTSWQEAYGGSDNAWKVAVLEGGLQWKETGMTAEDAQWIESRRFQVEDIARFFRVPLHMIGENSKSTSWGSGLEQLSGGFVIWTVVPMLTRDEQQFDRDFLSSPADGRYCKWNVSGLLRGDAKSRAESLRIRRQEGTLNADEWRELEEQNPIPDGSGQIYLRMANTTRLDGPDKLDAGGAGGSPAGSDPAPNDQPNPGEDA